VTTQTKTREREHDEQLVRLWIERDRAVQALGSAVARAYSALGFRTGYVGRRFAYFYDEAAGGPREARPEDAMRELRELEPTASLRRSAGHARDLIAEIERAFDARDDAREAISEHEQDYTGWTRYLIVTSSAGHVHSRTSCPTCRPTTTFGFVTDLSGKDEAEAIATVGETLCTVCFPDAPVNPSKLGKAEAGRLAWTPDRDEREAKRAAAEAEKAERDAAKAARGLKLAESLARKVDELVEQFGLPSAGRDSAAYESTWDRKGYDNAYHVWRTAR
jgi:hypothetical protein